MSLPRLNIEQERAKAAFGYATRTNKKGNYDGNAKKLPMYVLNNGLVNTIAFAYSKSDWEQLYLDIEDWFLKESQGLIKIELQKNKDALPEKDKKKALINTIISLDSNELRQVTTETLALFSWLRRFVKEE
jgi:CRISPR-associated protein Cmr5